MKPLGIDLFAGLGGFTKGLLAEGYECIGFDIERHDYGTGGYPAQLVLQNVLTLHGSQFKDAALIVASPPCQEFSWMAMPWSRAKQVAAALRGKAEFPEGYRGSRTIADLTALFNACFRIQREAIEAAGHFIPLVVENVRGVQPWVGRARWNFGSYYLFGDVPALMPMVSKRAAFKGGDRNIGRANGEHRWNTEFKNPGFRFDGSGRPFQFESVERTGFKSQGMNWSNRELRGQDFTRIAGDQAIKNNGGSWFNIAHNTTSGKGQNPDGRKLPGNNAPRMWSERRMQRLADGLRYAEDAFYHGSSGSNARKAASAMIARIPFALSSWIAKVYYPS